MDSSDLLLHPVRLRIVQTLMGDRALTTSQLAAELDDVSPATLYRHVGLLARAGVLTVVQERRVRGSVERTYALQDDAARLTAEDLADMGPEEHAAMFRMFVAGLLGDYDRYLASGPPDLVRDGVGYHMTGLWLSDEEFADFSRDLRRMYETYARNGPRPDRRRRIVRTVVMPAAAVPEAQPATGP